MNDIRTKRGALIYLPLLMLYLIHLHYVSTYAVNLPFDDEWQALLPEGLPSGFNLSWLFKFHNQHRIILTKMMTWIYFWSSGWNLKIEQVVNFLIFGLIILFFIHIKSKYYPKEFFTYPLFLIFLLSPIDYENHTWGFQSQIHFFILFGLVGILFATKVNGRLSDRWIAAACAMVSAYAFSGGVLFGLMTLVLLIYQTLKQPGKKYILPPLLLGLCLILWFHGFNPKHPLVRPDSLLFWNFYMNLIGLGFGQKVINAWYGFFWFCILVLMMAGLWASPLKRKNPQTLFLTASIMAILAVFACITTGRAGFGLWQSKNSRYSEIGMMLVPLLTLGVYYLFDAQVKIRRWLLAVLFIAIAFNFAGDYNFNVYKKIAQERNATLNCIRHFYERSGNGMCPGTRSTGMGMVQDFPEKLVVAKDIGVSFTRSMGPP